jgi:hypothetical protein
MPAEAAPSVGSACYLGGSDGGIGLVCYTSLLAGETRERILLPLSLPRSSYHDPTLQLSWSSRCGRHFKTVRDSFVP